MSLYEAFKRNLNETEDIESIVAYGMDEGEPEVLTTDGKNIGPADKLVSMYNYYDMDVPEVIANKLKPYGSKIIEVDVDDQYPHCFDEENFNIIREVPKDEYIELLKNAGVPTRGGRAAGERVKDTILNSLMNEANLEPEYSSRKSFYGKATIDDNDNTLVSYGTPIMRINDGKIEMLCRPEHLTQTTLRHIREFMQQNGMDPLPKNKLIKMIEEQGNINESDNVFKGYDQALPTVNDGREYLGYNLSDIVDAVEKFYGCNDRREAFNKVKNKEVSEEEIKKAMEYLNKPVYEAEESTNKDLYNDLLQKINSAFKEITGGNLSKNNIYLILPEDNKKAGKYALCNKRYNIGIGGKNNPYIKALKNIGATNIKVNNLGNIDFNLTSLNEAVSINGTNYYRVLNESGEEYYSIDPESITVAEFKESAEYTYPIINKALQKLVDDNQLNHFDINKDINGNIEVVLSYPVYDVPGTDRPVFPVDDSVDALYDAIIKSRDELEDDFYGALQDEHDFYGYDNEEQLKERIKDEKFVLTKLAEELNLIKDEVNMNESENLKESSNTIWSSEITEDNFDAAIMKEDYDEYVNSFEAFEDEYGNHIDEPKDFDEWKENYIIDHSDTEWEYLQEDFLENVCPMIDKQINNDILIVSGNYNSNYPDFRKSGPGGKFLNKAEDLLDWLSNEDRVDILNNDGIVGVAAYDHDGSIGGNLYTLPDDKELLYEIAKKTDYYDEDRDMEDVLGEFSYDLNHGNIDMSDLRDYADKFVPIKVEW